MKLQFKHQPFQAEAADAVCDVFCGQPYRTVTYRRDLGDLTGVQISTYDTEVGFRNQPLVPELTNRKLLDNLRAVQRRSGLKPSDELTGPGVNLSIEMETGTGKTYTYVKTTYSRTTRFISPLPLRRGWDAVRWTWKWKPARAKPTSISRRCSS